MLYLISVLHAVIYRINVHKYIYIILCFGTVEVNLTIFPSEPSASSIHLILMLEKFKVIHFDLFV